VSHSVWNQGTRRLDGRVALISGIATGVGRAGAQLFAREGAAIIGIDVDGRGAARTAADIEASAGRVQVVAGDAADAEVVRRAVQLAVAEYGKLDLLWSNAGIGVFKNIVDTTEAEWDRIITVNLKGAYLMANLGIPELIRAGGGTMVLTASVNSFVGAPSWAAYSATKGALWMLCRAMALDHAADNVRVNCVCPGSIATPLLDLAMHASGLPYEEAVERDRVEHPMGRVGDPTEVASAALFLSCAESSFTTGSALVVDGGFTAR
jgi:3-oxoacyl-[acyl-carrier protein] reductase